MDPTKSSLGVSPATTPTNDNCASKSAHFDKSWENVKKAMVYKAVYSAAEHDGELSMSPKKVWGIVLIVVGAVAVIGGISRYNNTASYGNEILSIKSAVAGETDTSVVRKVAGVDHRDRIRREKFIGVSTLLFGFSLAVLGTYLIKDETKLDYAPADDVLEMFDEPRFKL